MTNSLSFHLVFMYLITLRISSRQRLRILRSEQMDLDLQANLKISSALHMLKSHNFKSLISNLLEITQLPFTTKELWIGRATDDLVSMQMLLLKIQIHYLMLPATKLKFTSM